MKNYLGNLIARHLNQAEVLQPRLASRFEPQSSVLQAEAPEPETAGVEFAADSFEVDSFVTARESPIAALENERKVEGPPVDPLRLPETVFESSGPPAAIPNQRIHQEDAAPPVPHAKFQPFVRLDSPEIDDEPTPRVELTTPNIVASELREISTAPPTDAPSTHAPPTYASPVRRDEISNSEGVLAPAPQTPSIMVVAQPPMVVAQPPPTKAPDHVAMADDTVERTPRESDQPRETVKRSRRASSAKPNQTLMPARSVELQPQIQLAITETRRKTAVPIRDSAPPTSHVSPAESHQSPDAPKPRQPNIPVEVDVAPRESMGTTVTPGPETKSPVVDLVPRESQLAPGQRTRIPEEIRPPHQTRRAPALETSVVRWPRNDPMSGRMMFPHDIAPVEAGPTINVTIGRIEVRAATHTSEARPQKERREPQVLSLDEYLSQRSAGGR